MRVGPSAIQEAGHRFFIDMTPLLGHPLGRKVLKRVMGRLEARSGEILQQQSADPRLTSFDHISRGTIVRRSLSILLRTRAFFYIGQVLFQPEKAKKRVLGLKEQLKKQSEVRPETSASQRLTAAEVLLLQNTAATICNSLFTALPAFLLTVLAGKLLGDLATPEERQVVLRALPHNPTTEMDLALWDLAQQLRADASTAQFFLNTPHAQLVQQYHDQTLPFVFQRGLRAFLDDYGHRGVAEIDLGLPRWSEDPTYILGVLANYLQLDQFDAAPDLVFQRCAEEAEAMVTELVRRAATRGWVRSKLVGFCLRRGRALAGMREIAKFYLVLLLAGARRLLLSVADELVSTGCLEAPEDIFFLDIAEVRLALTGTSLRSVVQERRSSYAYELRRRHIPRILLSDGTEPEAALLNARAGGEDGQTLKGIPASAGKITAKARVVLDPADAHLEPGEILIAPSTDPGWTPLFLTAAGMVMEMGGPMSHGAVVAREYGIPAVVGVPGATRNIRTGQQITVDGSAGTILLVEEAA
ncbi:hypothetical protein KSC_043710 [Ktedonobacter sp. SOSP1-52]|uniref:PEP-utilizing enzyme n=1 Tax=Ktedonobacter sp. SOSP1-52 TaxID=2778366 RepID=UPI0019165225|nr:PEP-utilizing enzyme [Ktedonobacter sp. SOSP1-52]GHO65479.1 hypothetical protein KSC_043710 [Ktedonobacter sp. SOSP1-52]